MKLVEMRELSPDEINEQIDKSRIELVNLRMKFTARQLENPSLISKQRKEIARLLTIQTQKLKSGTDESKVEKKPEKNEVMDSVKKKEKKASSKKKKEEV